MANGKGFRLSTLEIIIFPILGVIMFLSKLLLEWAPNVHLLSVLTIAFTVVYRGKALFPIYIMVFLNGLFYGFQTWWVPYLYIWTILWAFTMLLPKNISKKFAVPLYMSVCALHGLLYGTLYAPFQALAFGLNFKGMITWIIAGLPFDLTHGISNFCLGVLILPITIILKKLNEKYLCSK